MQVKVYFSDYFNVKGIVIEKGIKFNDNDVLNSAQVAVIDNNTKNKLFSGEENPIGKIIFINKKPLITMKSLSYRNQQISLTGIG